MTPPPMMRAADVAAYMGGIDVSTVYRWRRKKLLPGRKINGIVLFRREDVERLCHGPTEDSTSPETAGAASTPSNGWTPAAVGPDLLARATSVLRNKP